MLEDAGKSDKTINAYVEALAIGAQFPLSLFWFF